MAKFFIDRPIFAWVVALIILLAGALAVRSLPIAQYPSIAPPSIAVTASYPGASAKVLEDAVTTVVEQEMNGLDGLLYIESTSESSGLASITLTFTPDTDPNIAQVQVQNRLKRVEARLPDEVRQRGVQVDKAVRNFLMFVTLSSTDGHLDDIALGNYMAASMLDTIRRVPGVGTADLFGSEYAMRIWLDPSKLTSYELTPSDVTQAIRAQNVQVTSGDLGALPAVKGQQLNATVLAQSRLSSPEQFGQILLRVNPNGSQVRIHDVATVELGGSDYVRRARVNGQPAAAIGIKTSPTANALATASALKATVAELAKSFPPGMQYDIPYDTSTFIKISIKGVVETLAEAVFLVFLVMYLFLQNIRATLIPTIVVPVALAGTFAAMLAFGFSINVLTLFGMVLAIGILVDDAIVVVENVERIMSEEGLSPRDATRKAMGQITNALIGITLVLTAVFIPMAFFGGSVGAIYRQFSLSLVSSMLFSVFLALTLTPALCATLLKPITPGQHTEKRGFFGWFNRMFNRNSRRYQNGIARILRKTGRMLLLYAAILIAVALLFLRMPSSFLPEEDQGYFITAIALPPGATTERTLNVVKKIESYYLGTEKAIDKLVAIEGYSFSGSGQNGALTFARLKDWDKRDASEHVKAVIGRAFGFFSTLKDAMAFAINPPPIPELGTSSGFDFRLQDRTGNGHEKLMEARNQLLGMAAHNPALVGVRPEGLEDTPQYQIDIDQQKASALGLSINNINDTLSIAFGSQYVNDFVRAGRVQRVIVQAHAQYRMLPQDINKLYVRNNEGKMVPFSAFSQAYWRNGSPRLERYNGFPSLKIVGNAAPGYSTGQAMHALETIAEQLPPGFGYAFSGQSFEERLSGQQAPLLFALSLLVVFLCLAALYESWSIPFAVMLVIPLGILGSLILATLTGLSNDVYFKVGLLAIIGLSAKNAILIIEFAKDLQAQGKDLISATLEAVHLRLRPIIMTSMAFILGVLPLALATGAGSSSQRAIGTGVVGGMITATVLAIFLVPVFFVVVRRIFPSKTINAPSVEHDHASQH
ncbi:MAG: efflux RND transporter permease subunit [Ottowia sp.]|nr:efflux RND transporter permease subunit [Ottowia sp.]